MAEIEADTLVEQAVLIGLLSQSQAREAREDAEDGSVEALARVLLRKGMLTGWQVERLKKGDLSGLVLGGCQVLFHIAEGTFARVYRGRKTPGDQPVAIKVLRQRFVSDPGAIARFNEEAEAGLKLNHPNIVRIYDYGEQDKRYYMIMEYVPGSNLRDFMKIRKRLEPGAALPLMLGLARGLQYSIAQGVTHRDIKPTNILVSHAGEAKLVDFGLATIEEGQEKQFKAAHGQRTVDYAALERTCGSPKGDPRSDIFFLGCVYYQMVTGQLPLPEVEVKDPLQKMLKRSFGAIKPLSEHRHAPPEALGAIIEKMMKMDLKARYQSMDDVVRDLEAFEAGLKAPAAPAEAPDQSLDDEFAALFGPERFREKEKPSRTVLCVEYQEEIRDALRKTLSKMGYRVLLVGDAERAAERFREAPPDCVVFDADGLGDEALGAFNDMHEKAHEDGHALSAVVLLGPKQRHLGDRLPTDDRLVVLQKPIKMKQLQDALAQLVPAG